jgi:hypothetical protein
VLVVAGMALPAFAAENLVANGSFEDAYPPFACSADGPFWRTVGYGCNPAGDRIPGWQETTLTPGAGVDWTIDLFGNDSGPAQDGLAFVDLVGTGHPGRIEQAVPTTAGGRYRMTFHYTTHAAGFCVAGGVASATATAGASSIVVAAFGGAPWTQISLDFIGTGPTTPIAFAGNEIQPCGGILIDNVAVEALLPTTKDECKNGGWQSFGVFKNQGDCVSFVATGGKNKPAN